MVYKNLDLQKISATYDEVQNKTNSALVSEIDFYFKHDLMYVYVLALISWNLSFL